MRPGGDPFRLMQMMVSDSASASSRMRHDERFDPLASMEKGNI
jgi:hypothetical protein